MSKHTQGPWTAHPDIGEDTRGMGWIRTQDGRDVSCYGTQELWMSENIANGKLMAAAPDLLAAAKQALRLRDETCESNEEAHERFSWIMDQLAAAIAKATTGEA